MSDAFDDRRRGLEEEYFNRKNKEAIEKLRAKMKVAAQETDTAKRKAMYEDLQKQVTDNGPFIIMFQPANQVASRVNVQGYKPGIIEDEYFFRTITKS